MLSPFATARCNTSSVAIIVTATPVTTVLGSPVLNVSTVFSRHSTPTWLLIASTTSCAVTFFFSWADVPRHAIARHASTKPNRLIPPSTFAKLKPSMPATIQTIGHSNHSADHFLQLLKSHQIEVVVDTRSQPYSNYAT